MKDRLITARDAIRNFDYQAYRREIGTGVTLGASVLAILGLIAIGGGDETKPVNADPNTLSPKENQPAALVVEANQKYVVVAGDTLNEIAQRFGLELDQIIQANPQLVNPDMISVGQELTIPADSDGLGERAASGVVDPQEDVAALSVEGFNPDFQAAQPEVEFDPWSAEAQENFDVSMFYMNNLGGLAFQAYALGKAGADAPYLYGSVDCLSYVDIFWSMYTENELKAQ